MTKLTKYIFERTPLCIKGYLLGAYSWLTHGRKYGPIYAAELAQLRSTRLKDRLHAIHIQQRKLAELLCDIRKSNQHFESEMLSRGITEDQIHRDPTAALKSLAEMDKAWFKSNIERIISSNIPTAFIAHTSGTTGSPMSVPYCAAGYQRGFAYWRRFYDEMGLPSKFRNARFSGRMLLPANKVTNRPWVFDWYERRLFLSSYHLTTDLLPKYAEALGRFKPHLIDGYPSAIQVIAQYILDHNLQGKIRPQAVATTAESISESARETIQAAFDCHLFNQYAASEGVPFITECKSGRLHLNIDTGVFEFTDYDTSSDAKELVVTSFRNIKTPLVRYKTGDSVYLDHAQTPCTCGSPFPTVSHIFGRLDDILISPERGPIGRLDPIFKGLKGIDRSQIVQHTLHSFEIRVQLQENLSATNIQGELEALLRNFKDRVGHSVEVQINIVDNIALGSNGKFRAVVRSQSIKAP